MKKTLVCFFGFLFLVVTSVSAQIRNWKTHTPMNQIQRMAVVDSTIWCETEGGLAAFDIRNKTFRTWTNTEGLASVQLSAVSVDRQKRIYLGFLDGSIQRFDPSSSAWLLLNDYQGHPVYSLYPAGDTLFVGLDIGLSVYRLNKKEVKETYRHLGPTFPVEIPVRHVSVSGREIWVATDAGIVRSSLDFPNLLDPNAWTDYYQTGDFPLYPGRDILVWNGEPVAATDRGVARFRNGQWGVLGNGFPSAEVFDLCVHQNQLIAATSSGVYELVQNQWLRNPLPEIRCQSAVSAGGILWVGTDTGLALFSDQQQKWIEYRPNCPASNLFSDLTVDLKGVLWCASANAWGKGFYRFDGTQWTNYSTLSNPSIPWNDIFSMASDNRNGKWFGTWGRGLWYWDEKSAIRIFTPDSGYLSGIQDHPEYAVVADVAVDSNGTVWMLNYQSARLSPLVSLTRDSIWTYYGGFSTSECRHLAIDPQGRKWIGTEYQGVMIYDDRGTPAVTNDDAPLENISTSNGLASNKITALAMDPIGGAWIGTSRGLFYFENGTAKQNYGPLSDNITQLLMDGAGNLWVGTTAGLSFFSIHDYAWTHYHSGNSGLVGNEITSLAMDYHSGKLYVGTTLGLSVLETPYSKPLPAMSELKIYPNPYKPSEQTNLVIGDLSEGVTVCIFSPGGYLIRRFKDQEVFGRQIFWDGSNDNGEPVSGGIYLIVQQNESGKNRIGKVALIR